MLARDDMFLWCVGTSVHCGLRSRLSYGLVGCGAGSLALYSAMLAHRFAVARGPGHRGLIGCHEVHLSAPPAPVRAWLLARPSMAVPRPFLAVGPLVSDGLVGHILPTLD